MGASYIASSGHVISDLDISPVVQNQAERGHMTKPAFSATVPSHRNEAPGAAMVNGGGNVGVSEARQSFGRQLNL